MTNAKINKDILKACIKYKAGKRGAIKPKYYSNLYEHFILVRYCKEYDVILHNDDLLIDLEFMEELKISDINFAHKDYCKKLLKTDFVFKDKGREFIFEKDRTKALYISEKLVKLFDKATDYYADNFKIYIYQYETPLAVIYA